MKGRQWAFFAILLSASAVTLQGAEADAQWLGVLWTKGSVSVGDAQVSSGATISPGDAITTSPGGTAWLRFRSPASTILLADSQMSVFGGDGAPGIVLRRGTVIVDEKLSSPLQVTVSGGFVLLKADPQSGAECEMAEVENAATVSVKRGLAEIHGHGAPVILRPGESARLEDGPQGSPEMAGKINRVIPQGVIQREGQLKELPLTLNAIVDWNDLVRTLQVGRAQILLVDGSTLNVGARSEIKILKHVPDKHQTEI